MILARLKQAYIYFFVSWNPKKEEEVRNFLSEEEFLIFQPMKVYDKNHSYFLWKKIRESTLKNFEIYHKLALLHDCGKEEKGFMARCFTVFWGREKTRDIHSDIAYRKLQDINLELAELCQQHHQRSEERRVGKECRSRWSPYH